MTSWSDRIRNLMQARGLNVNGISEVLSCDPELVVSIRIGNIAGDEIPALIRKRIEELEVDAGLVTPQFKQYPELPTTESARKWERAQHRGGSKYCKSLREAAGVGIEEFSLYFGVPADTVREWESGQPIPRSLNQRLIMLGQRFERDGSLPPYSVLAPPSETPMHTWDQAEQAINALRAGLRDEDRKWEEHLQVAFWWRILTLGLSCALAIHLFFGR